MPGVQVEVLPKIDNSGATVCDEVSRGNLVYMLELAGHLRARDRGTAGFQSTAMPLLDVLAGMFAERLQRELLRGADAGYIVHEENLRRFRGRLLTSVHMRANAARRDRMFCRFDEFSPDTDINRVFKSACRILLRTARTARTATQLRQCLFLLEDVSNESTAIDGLAEVRFSRQNRRFAPLFEFALLVLKGRALSLRAGENWSFSLMYDMNVVFERFVAEFLRRFVRPKANGMFVLQARGAGRFLMRDVRDAAGVFRLQPDILVTGKTRRDYVVVMDTKWKVPTNRRPSLADAYQMYAYLDCYGSDRCVLLYPKTMDSTPRDFERIAGLTGKKQVLQVRFADLFLDLRKRGERDRLAEQLRQIVDSES